VRITAQVFLAYGLLLLLGAVWRLLPIRDLLPDIVALFAAYLGLTARQKLAPSVAGAVIIGYLADLLVGSPAGLLAITSGIICTACHLIQGRLLVRGVVFTMIFAALTALASGLLILGFRAMGGILAGGWSAAMTTLLGTTLLTGLLGPFVFRACRIVDSRFARTRRERDAAATGQL
jgi:cell shape-determining protein MreD